MDGAAAIADYKHIMYHPAEGAHAPHVQINHLDTGAVCANRVGTCLTRSKVGQGGSVQKPVCGVINLCETAPTVKPPDPDDGNSGPLMGREISSIL